MATNGSIRERFWRLVEEERHWRRPSAGVEPAGGPTDAERFAPVREAAHQISAQLTAFPELSITIKPESVGIDLYDRYFWFGIDPKSGRFAAKETSFSWLEGEFREDPSSWDNAAACIDALIRACARYVALADAIRAMRPQSH